MDELDRVEIKSNVAFTKWLEAWRDRWIAGAPIRVRVALDNSHAIVLLDEHAPRPRSSMTAKQLALFHELAP
jgi:hypothetical protein